MNIKELLQTADKQKEEIQKKLVQKNESWLERIKKSNPENFMLLESEWEAFRFIMEKISQHTFVITEELMKQLHGAFSSTNSLSGYYRKEHVLQPGGKGKAPAPEDLAHLMEHFIGQMNTSKSFFHPIEFVSFVYKRFLDMQPFSELNNLVADFLLNGMLVNEGYGIAFIQPETLEGFGDALKVSQNIEQPNMDPLIRLVAESVICDQSDFIKTL